MISIREKLIINYKKIKKKFCDPNDKNWKVFLADPRLDPKLREMLLSFASKNKEFSPSEYWEYLMVKNINQLIENGFENLKQKVALDYFTWAFGKKDPRLKYFNNILSKPTINRLRKDSQKYPQQPFFTAEQANYFNFITLLFWEYLKMQGLDKLLNKVSEPAVGNPPSIKINHKLFSQDLANSILEYQAILEGVGDFNQIKTIIEIGAGYGRTAFTILSLKPKIKYLIVDIPPALYIAQRYLTQVFPKKRIFRFREFDNFSQVKKEFISSEIAFFMPFQLKILPDKIAQMCLAINCLHEMLPQQIKLYFKEFNRLADNLYFKCWKKTIIPYDLIMLEEKSYPVFKHWRQIFWRPVKVHPTFFEAFLVLRSFSR